CSQRHLSGRSHSCSQDDRTAVSSERNQMLTEMRTQRNGRGLVLKTAILTCVGLAAIAVGLAVRGSGAISTATPAAQASASRTRAIVKVGFHQIFSANSTHTRAFLVDGRGITLYAFTFDDSGKPACYTDPGFHCKPTWPSCVNDPQYNCIKSWPALTTGGIPRAGAGASP